MNSKGSLELSVEFIVIFIISVVIFSLSVYFAVTFFSGAEEIRLSIDAETESKIQDLFAQSGTTVAFPLNKKEAYLGDQVIFGIGILNLVKDIPGVDPAGYYVRVRPHRYIDERGIEQEIDLTQSTPPGPEHLATMQQWLRYSPNPNFVEYNEYNTVPILVELQNIIGKQQGQDIATKRGTYIFNVCVFRGDPSPPGQNPLVCDKNILGHAQLYSNQVYKLYVTVR